MKKNEEREPTPFTAPELFEYTNIKGKKVALKKKVGEVWEADLLHGNHYEVYTSRKQFEKGVRNRAVYVVIEV